MTFLRENVFKKRNKNDELIILKEQLEKGFHQLKENVFYGQQLLRIGSWTRDFKTEEVFLSDEVYYILDCNSKEFDGKLENYYSYIHPNDLEEVKTVTQEALEGKEYDIEYRIITSCGVEKYVHEKTKTLFDENNNASKMVGIIQDKTNQRLIENNKKLLSNDLNEIQKVAGLGNWKYDIINDEILWSEEVYRIFDIDPISFNMEFEGLLELIHPEDRIKMQNVVEGCLGGTGYQLEYRIPQQNGTEKYVLTKGEPLFDQDRRVVGILGTLQDITEIKQLEEKLRKNYESLAEAQRLAHIGSWQMNMANGKIDWSEETYRIFDISSEEFDCTFEGYLKFVHPDDVKLFFSSLENLPKEPFDMEYRILRSDGSIRYVYHMITIIFDKDDNPAYIHGTTQDITEKKELQWALEIEKEEINRIQKRFEILVQESSDIFEIISPDGTIKYMSEAAKKVIGFSPAERIGRKVFEFYEGEELHKLTRMFNFVLNGFEEKTQEELLFKTKAGKNIYLEVYMQNLIHEPVIQGIVVNIREITKRVELEKKMIHISTHDELTNLPNSVYFRKKLESQCQHTEETQSMFALMMLDIDGLKYINFSLGNEIWQQLIIEVVHRLESFVGKDKFLCRYSEDHFAILVEGVCTNEEYENIARGIIGLFLLPFRVETYELDLSVNVGICIYPKDTQDRDALIKQVKISLLRAKKEGKNTFKFHSSDLDIQNYKESVLRNDLRYAIEKGQFRVYYQPIVNLKTNDLVAAEALIRWEHPDWGVVSPSEFIPLAEETGLIIDMGKWVLREVCKNYNQWLTKGLLDIKVSVNFSPVQFLENDFVKNIKNIIAESKLECNFLVMEITESVLIKNPNKAISDIQDLQSSGIQVALDDFGTGFSSLAYLNSFNIDIIKLDGSFIRNIPFDYTSTTIIKALIHLAKELKIRLVAEQIETWEQLGYLKDNNCTLGQGYIYSKPLELTEFEKILIKRKCKPKSINSFVGAPREEKRKFFRIKFNQLLEADLTILKLKNKNLNVGYTKVLIKNIGPGGLCFISNIKFPIQKDISLQFITRLMDYEIKLTGCPVWTEEVDKNIFEYGIEFSLDESDRDNLVKILNQVLVKMRNNILFAEGNFVSVSHLKYFTSILKNSH